VIEQTEIPVKITLDAQRARSETLASSVGAYVLVIDTVLPDRGVSLHSTYAGHTRTDTLATHLLLATGAYNAICERHKHDQLPVIFARRRCLYDHLHQLQDLLDRLGLDATIPVDDAVIAAVER
jgi:hypothetical protein